MLKKEEITRYSRHLLLPGIGMEGQEKLKAASVLVVGAGGLGSPLSMYLAAAGVGCLGLVDFDEVDESNLQRQILYGHSSIGKLKLDAAEARLRDLNEYVAIRRHPVRLGRDNALEIIREYDVVVDGTDNFPTRYLVNDACVLSGKPNVYGSIFQFDGQVSIFGAPGGPCYRCVYPEPPPPGLVPSCAEGGVLGVLPGIIGSIQAAEVIKWICGLGDSLVGRLLLFDALEMQFRTLKVHHDPHCSVCGESPTVTELIDYEDFCSAPGDTAVELSDLSAGQETTSSDREQAPMKNLFASFSKPPIPEMSTFDLKEKLDKKEDLLILDVRTAAEYGVTNIGGTLIPLPELGDRLQELESHRNREIVVVCRSGARSGSAVALLMKAGFERVINLKGGLMAWADTIDSSVPKY